MKKNALKETTSPCNGCLRINNFSFGGCFKDCEKIRGHIKRVLSQTDRSPCKNFRCGIPGADAKGRERCTKCRLPQIYADQLGSGPKSALSRQVVPPPNDFYKPWFNKRHYR